MKIRYGFVTNSSSSSYIIGLSKKASKDAELAFMELSSDNPHIESKYIFNLLDNIEPIGIMHLQIILTNRVEDLTRYWTNHISSVLDITDPQKLAKLRELVNKYFDDKYARILKEYPSGTEFYSVTYPHDGDGGTEEDNIMAKHVMPSIDKAIYYD